MILFSLLLLSTIVSELSLCPYPNHMILGGGVTVLLVPSVAFQFLCNTLGYQGLFPLCLTSLFC